MALLKDGTRVYGTLNANASVLVGNSTVNSSMTNTYLQVANSTTNVNVTSVQMTIQGGGLTTVANSITVSTLTVNSSYLKANSGFGTAGQILYSGGAASNAYWGALPTIPANTSTTSAAWADANNTLTFTRADSSTFDVGISFGEYLVANDIADFITANDLPTNTSTSSAAYTVANNTLTLTRADASAFDVVLTGVANTSSPTFSGDVTIQGNLVTQGTLTYINTTQLQVDDNIITLAANQTSGAVNAGIEVDRGSDANVSILWNETDNKWTLTNDGSTYANIAVVTDIPATPANTSTTSAAWADANNTLTFTRADSSTFDVGISFGEYLTSTDIAAFITANDLPANTSTSNASLSGNTVTFTRADASTFDIDLTSIASAGPALPSTIDLENTTDTATATGANSIAIGANTSVDNTSFASIVIGTDAFISSNTSNGIAIGVGASVSQNAGTNTSIGGIAIGAGATSRNAQGNFNFTPGIAIGRNANSDYYGTSVGTFANSSSSSVAIGYTANAGGSASVAIGARAAARTTSGIAIGDTANTYLGQYAIAIGVSSYTTSNASIAIGRNAKTAGYNVSNNSIVIGATANTTSFDTINLGGETQVTGARSIAIGRLAKAFANDAIAIGYNVEANVDNQILIGLSSQYVEIAGDLYLDGGLQANGGLGSAGQILTSNGSSVYWDNQLTLPANTSTSNAVLSGNTVTFTRADSSTFGVDLTSIASSGAALPSTIDLENTAGTANASGANSIAIGAGASATTTGAIAIGNDANVTSANGTAIGWGAEATGSSGSTALGKSARATGLRATALGENCDATFSYSAAIGFNSDAAALGSLAVGYLSQTIGQYSIAVGHQAKANANYGIAIGYTANVAAVGLNGIAIGYQARSNYANSIAFGTGAQTTSIGQILLGTASHFVQVPGDLYLDGGLQANGGFGSAGQVLTSNSSGVYWSTVSGGGGGSLPSTIDMQNEVDTATASGSNSMSFGANTTAAGDSSIAVGVNIDIDANADYSVAIGYGVVVDTANTIMLGNHTGTQVVEISGNTYNKDDQRMHFGGTQAAPSSYIMWNANTSTLDFVVN